MRLLPHDTDDTCSDGRGLGSMPKLWANGHFAHACTSRCSGAAVVSRASSSSAPGSGIATSVGTPLPITHDGRPPQCWHAVACFEHRIATEACSRSAASQFHAQCARRSDTVVLDSRNSHGGDGCACRTRRSRHAQSFASHPRCTRFAQHARRQCRRDARHANPFVGCVTPRPRGISCTRCAHDAAASARWRTPA